MSCFGKLGKIIEKKLNPKPDTNTEEGDYSYRQYVDNTMPLLSTRIINDNDNIEYYLEKFNLSITTKDDKTIFELFIPNSNPGLITISIHELSSLKINYCNVNDPTVRQRIIPFSSDHITWGINAVYKNEILSISLRRVRDYISKDIRNTGDNYVTIK